MIKRRDFLKTAALSSAALVIPNINIAQPQTDSKYLLNNSFLRINGIGASEPSAPTTQPPSIGLSTLPKNSEIFRPF